MPTRLLATGLKPLAGALLSALALSGCSFFSTPGASTPQTAIDQRVLGLSVGDFFGRYGPPRSRVEAKDGSLTFDWVGGTEYVPAGPRGPEELICRLQVSADRQGRIVAALIVRDGPGEHSLSRCAELFGAA